MQPSYSRPPWKTEAEALDALAEGNRRAEAAATAGSIQIETDEGFHDYIQLVAGDSWTYQDVYRCWIQLSPDQWTAHGFPLMAGDPHPHYGRMVRFILGPHSGQFGVYLRPRDGGRNLHLIALLGPPSAGTLKTVLAGENHFLVKSLEAATHLQQRGGGFVPIYSPFLAPAPTS